MSPSLGFWDKPTRRGSEDISRSRPNRLPSQMGCPWVQLPAAAASLFLACIPSALCAPPQFSNHTCTLSWQIVSKLGAPVPSVAMWQCGNVDFHSGFRCWREPRTWIPRHGPVYALNSVVKPHGLPIGLLLSTPPP